MIELVIIPRQSIGPFKLGSSRDEIRAAALEAGISIGHGRENIDYFADGIIQVEYDEDVANFMGVSTSTEFRGIYRGVNISDISAQDLFQLAADADDSGPHEYNRFEYCFPNQILTLWEADDQYDRIRRRSGEPLRVMWAQVGIGTPEYVEAVRKIEEKFLKSE